MSTIWWIVIIALFVLSIVGLVVPILPSVLLVWAGFLVYHFLINSSVLSAFFWIAMGLLTLLLFVGDFVANAYFVKKYGGTKAGSWAAVIGAVIGAFVVPPFGMIIIPFIAVLVTETFTQQAFDKAWRAAIGSMIAFFSSTFAKGIIQLTMIIWFLIAVL